MEKLEQEIEDWKKEVDNRDDEIKDLRLVIKNAKVDLDEVEDLLATATKIVVGVRDDLKNNI